MATNATPSSTSASTPPSSTAAQGPQPTKFDPQESENVLRRFREGEEAAKLVSWVLEQYEKAKTARHQKQLQWYVNMAYFYGQQWLDITRRNLPTGYQDRLMLPKKPYYQQRKTVNRTRSFVRTELSKFLSKPPSVIAVPATGEDEDLRSSYAAEQAWQSIQSARKLRTHYGKAAWWMILTGNGFVKTWWDNTIVNPFDGTVGDICYGSVTPFHLFVPDLREQEIEDQPFIINAYVKPIEWAKTFFGDALKGVDLKASATSQNTILDSGVLNLQQTNSNQYDSCVIYETWIKPNATRLLPEGGVVITIDTHLISIERGWPYAHGMYPYSKFEHIPTATFYADSPLVDTNQLQRDYNTLRSEISEAGRRTARPALIAAKGSIVPSKVTNEPGQIIEYKPGLPKPDQLVLPQLPQWYLQQGDTILSDWEAVTGQHDVSRGEAPPGVKAGTAISFLQEKDDQYLTPQYQSIEDGYEKIARSTIGLFVQYVDLPRKIKVIGADDAFDTMLLSGADLRNGTDVRVEQGSSIGESRAAQRATVMDMFSIGLIDQPTALQLLEMGGVQKVQDVMKVAARKAQRENIKMKMLDEMTIQQSTMQFMSQAMQTDPNIALTLQTDPNAMMQLGQQAPPVVPVDDFDVHQAHIETHNKFRMGQEYETLPQPVKDEFAKHVAQHMQMLSMQMMAAPQPAPGDTPKDQPESGPGATMKANGAVPEAPMMTGA